MPLYRWLRARVQRRVVERHCRQGRWDIESGAVEIHVTPVDDHIEHDPDGECPCGPTCEPVKRRDGSVGWLYVHHSLDGRERVPR